MNKTVEKYLEQEALKLTDGKEFKSEDEVNAFIRENFETIVENALAANWKTAVEAMNNKNNPRHVCKVMALKMWHECQHEKLNRGFRFELATL